MWSAAPLRQHGDNGRDCVGKIDDEPRLHARTAHLRIARRLAHRIARQRRNELSEPA
jgi:hypothetical protein